MSNFSKKIKHQNNQEPVMQRTKELYYLKGMVIEALNYNKNYFKESEHLLEAYKPVFSDYFDKSEIEIMPFTHYLERCVEEYHMLNNTMRECDFSIKNEHIIFQDTDNTQIDFINMGQFIFQKCKINVCDAYMFVEDLTTDIKYLYYEK